MELAVTYDYRCPFTWNFHSHLFSYLKNNSLEIDFLPFFLDATHINGSSQEFWTSKEAFENSRALRLSIVIKNELPDRFINFHEQVFRYRFEKFQDINSQETLTEVLKSCVIDVAFLNKCENLSFIDALRKIHESLIEKYQIFGVPTLIWENKSVFVRLMEPSLTADRSVKLLDVIFYAMQNYPELNEFKYTQLSS